MDKKSSFWSFIVWKGSSFTYNPYPDLVDGRRYIDVL